MLFSGVRLEASEIVEEWNSPQVGGPRLYGHSALQRLALRKVGRCEQRWVILPWPGRLGAGPVPAGATAASGPGAVSRASHSFTCHARRAAAPRLWKTINNDLLTMVGPAFIFKYGLLS